VSDGLVTFVLLPDARESEGPVTRINNWIRAKNVSTWQYTPPFRPVRMAGPRAWHTYGLDDMASTDIMMDLLRLGDWEYPAIVALRGDSENRWSWVTLGLTVPELGEE
jgi:hypothetical protein